ncbi:MAG: MobA/MobL family protein [Lachnospiraceae bacterium]|nr:MobA/MobL family protein [Lachnospiraceae bacterium]
MAIFHFTVKIIGRSKGRSVISASAYLNGDVMKNEETGEFSRYTSKKEVVFSHLSMCANAPPEWQTVPEENIKRFMNSTRYKHAEDKGMALRKFKTSFQKQRLWNEVLKVEKSSDAQLARSFEFSLPREWSRVQQIQFANLYIRRNFVEKGMCADWSIHDKGDGNPHVHLLVTMRPFNPDHTWGSKEMKDWAFVRDEQGNPVIDPSHPNWWQDKKNPERCGIRIPLLDSDGNQKTDSRNRKQWKRVLTDATGWNNPKNCELWREDWAIECNSHLPPEHYIDHRSFARQGKVELPTIHEGANARKIAEKFQAGENGMPSWKAEENQSVKEQNDVIRMVQENLKKLSKLLEEWKGRLYDLRRKRRAFEDIRRIDSANRRTAGSDGRTLPGTADAGKPNSKTQRSDFGIEALKHRIADIADIHTRYERIAADFREAESTRGRDPALEDLCSEYEQRKRAAAETERRIAAINQSRSRSGQNRSKDGQSVLITDHEDRILASDQDSSEALVNKGTSQIRENQQIPKPQKRQSVLKRLDEKKKIVAEREQEKEQNQNQSRRRGRSR